MSQPLGSLCIVLHGHLPYVLHHGSFPHGEAWLYEAAAETYLPMLDLIGEVALHGARPGLTIGLTPVLLEQLDHDRFKNGFVEYLHGRVDQAAADRKQFMSRHDRHFAHLAERWGQWYQHRLEQFEQIARDIPGAFAQRCREGHIQILTSNATHAYMPLLLNDQMLRAQLSAGTSTSHRILGIAPRGMWLPECAYRPTQAQWKPPVLYGDARHRVGIERFIADAGVTHFFVDTHLICNGHPWGVIENSEFREMNETQIYWDRRGWREPVEPVGVSSEPRPPEVFAFARHPRVSEQVWSRSIGYPGAAEYLEFHRKQGDLGLRYHKVTSNQLPLDEKHPYEPRDVEAMLFEHAQHFCDVVRDVLRDYESRTGRQGVLVAPFDAELFGHWWFEGPGFLRNVILNLAHDQSVRLTTAEEALHRHPPDKVMRLPEGSWGENGDHSVWMNERTRWMWEIEYRAEGRLLKDLHELPWRDSEQVRAMMTRAARELLLLQASDWPFVIHSHGAVDYGIQRFSGHATRFDRMCDAAESIARGRELSELQRVQVAEADAHDAIFMDLQLDWWM